MISVLKPGALGALALSLAALAPLAAAQEVAITTSRTADVDALEDAVSQLKQLKELEALGASGGQLTALREAVFERTSTVTLSGSIEQMPLPDALLAIAEHGATAGARFTLAMSATDRESLAGLVVTVRFSKATVAQALKAVVAPYSTGEHGLVVELDEDDGVFVVRAVASDEPSEAREDDDKDDEDKPSAQGQDEEREDGDDAREEMASGEDQDDPADAHDAHDAHGAHGEHGEHGEHGDQAQGEPEAAPGFLGISYEPAGQGEIGVRLTEVVDGSPAAEAGLKVGDRVIHLNGRPFQDLRKLIQARHVGQSVSLTIKGADGTLRQVQVTLGERPTGE